MEIMRLKVAVMLIVMLLVPQSIFAMEHQKMKMDGDHASMNGEANRVDGDHGGMATEQKQMAGEHGQMMDHPEMMDHHMNTHHEHVKTMERVFRYERNLAEKAEKIVVGYLYKKGDHQSEKDKDAMVMMAQTMVTDGLARKSILFIPIGLSDEVVMADQIVKVGANVIYIGKNLSHAELEAVRGFALQKKILSIGSSGAQTEQGITAVGIDVQKERVNLIISMVTAKQQGVDFDPRLYRLADKVIK